MNIVLGLLAALGAGTSDFLGGLGSRRVAAIYITAAGQTVGFVVAAVLTTLVSGEFAAADLMWGGLAGLAGAAGLLSIYAGYANGRVAIAAPLAGVGTAAIPVVVGAIRGTDITTSVGIGIAVGLAAIALTSFGGEGGHGGVGASLLYGLGGAAGLGLLLVLLAEGSDDGGMWPLIAARAGASTALVAAIVASRPPIPERRAIRRATPIVLGIGLLGTAANACFILASRNGSIAVAAVLTSLFPAVTVLWAWAVLKERLRGVQLAGLGLALVAIGLIAAG